MGHSDLDPAVHERRPWNAGLNVGPKRPLKPRDIWAISSTSMNTSACEIEHCSTSRSTASCAAAISSSSRLATLPAAGISEIGHRLSSKRLADQFSLRSSPKPAGAWKTGCSADVARYLISCSQAGWTTRGTLVPGNTYALLTIGSQRSASIAASTARILCGEQRRH